MIVGTEGPNIMEDQDQDQDQGETKETSSEQGETAGDGGTGAAQPAQTQPVQTQPAQQGGGGGGGGPKDPTSDILRSLARAEAMKSLEGAAADLYSPEKQKARDDLRAAYKKALDSNGELRVKLNKAHDSFDRAAADMLPRIAKWVPLFDKNKPGRLAELLAEREKTKASLEAGMGKYELIRANKQAETKKWADAHANWSSPVEKMTAMVGEYADKIDNLSGEINTSENPDAAMLSFWLEVAPKHVQLTDRKFSQNANQAVTDVRGALAAHGLDWKLKNGKDRKDGSLYVLKESELQGARKAVLTSWFAAAEAQADADADFKQYPDDLATVKKRWDELKDDAWLKEAESKLEKKGG